MVAIAVAAEVVVGNGGAVESYSKVTKKIVYLRQSLYSHILLLRASSSLI